MKSGIIGTVGYVGWAALGGYGPFGPQYGLGLDQIVGAKVVNAEGKIVTADARMLKGIRGACGNFGVIVEVTVKVYPLPKVANRCPLSGYKLTLLDQSWANHIRIVKSCANVSDSNDKLSEASHVQNTSTKFVSPAHHSPLPGPRSDALLRIRLVRFRDSRNRGMAFVFGQSRSNHEHRSHGKNAVGHHQAHHAVGAIKRLRRSAHSVPERNHA